MHTAAHVQGHTYAGHIHRGMRRIWIVISPLSLIRLSDISSLALLSHKPPHPIVRHQLPRPFFASASSPRFHALHPPCHTSAQLLTTSNDSVLIEPTPCAISHKPSLIHIPNPDLNNISHSPSLIHIPNPDPNNNDTNSNFNFDQNPDPNPDTDPDPDTNPNPNPDLITT